jgi:hypothetical protein
MSDAIDETAILDGLIRDLQTRLEDEKLDFDDRMKLQDRLLKALAMRRKDRGKKGRGFDLG